MRIATALASAAVALTMAVAATPSNAGPALPKLAPAGGYVVNVADWDGPRHGHHWRGEHRGPRIIVETGHRRGHGHGYGYGHRWGGPRIVYNACRAWRNECADRWPRMGWRYERCLSNHGC